MIPPGKSGSVWRRFSTVAALVVLLANCETVSLGREGDGSATTKRIAVITALSALTEPATAASHQIFLARIEALGFTTEVLDQSTTSLPTDDFVATIISSTANASNVQLPLRTLPVPTLILESWAWPLAGLTGGDEYQDYDASLGTEIEVEPGGGPVTQGLSGRVPVLSSEGSLNSGRPASGAAIEARRPGSAEQISVFTFDVGAALIEGTAPARRVGLFLRTETIAQATGAALQMFDAALLWVTGT